MGKTITSQLLVKILDEKRQEHPSWPLPLYFDLRKVTIRENQPVPDLKTTLEECMKKGWLGLGEEKGYTLENVMAWIEQGAVVILDGLDEALVKMNEAEGQEFTAGLIKLLEEAKLRAEKKGPKAKPVKMLITCRTHYFRTLRDQVNHFASERGYLKAEDYRALVLLPLTEEQIRRYFQAAFPEMDLERLLETINSVHNLKELTRRPYTLKLVAAFIPEIEEKRSLGQKVYGVTLYRELVKRWLERDSGKHQIRKDHKLKLAAHLAAYLWQRGSGQLPVSEIEDWFHQWLVEQPVLKARYDKIHPDRLEEDLRTATFLVREDRGEESFFRFAHTSIFEYFLAEYLFQALKEKAPSRWEIKRPSPETLDFLGQILAETDNPALLETMSSWGKEKNPLRNQLILAYTLRAVERGWPAPSLRGINLEKTDLENFYLHGSQEAPLDFRKANFSHANLRRAIFENVLLEGASFKGAKLAQANFLNCEAKGVDWRGAECYGTIWRYCHLEKGCWGDNPGRGEFVFCTGLTQNLKSSFLRMSHIISSHHVLKGELSLNWFSGHEDSVYSCAFSPDGSLLASASGDGTVKVWELASRKEILSLSGHKGPVYSCAFSPDGSLLASANGDGAVKVWELASGKLILSLSGHKGSVHSCAFSPDGSLLASASRDGTVKVWELSSGKLILSLSGHKDWVLSCAFSPDGSLIASASWDGTVKIWEVESGKLLRIHAVARFEHPSGRVVLSHAVWEPEENRILDLGGEAWRYLAWVRWRPDAPPERLPLEAFKTT